VHNYIWESDYGTYMSVGYAPITYNYYDTPTTYYYYIINLLLHYFIIDAVPLFYASVMCRACIYM